MDKDLSNGQMVNTTKVNSKIICMMAKENLHLQILESS